MLGAPLARLVYPAFRRVDFRGKGRLRSWLPVPAVGERVVGFPGGVELRLDLREQIQRDFLFGLYDRYELELVRRHLRGGGDFVDVGAHIGMYSVAAALALRGRGRVLALEPNPAARAQLLANLALNGCDSAIVSPRAIAEGSGTALLHVPSTTDPSFSSLRGGRFSEGEPIPIETATLDEEVERAGVRPALVKIDVEGGELAVLAGMERTLADRPALLVELSEATAPEVLARLGEGYAASRVLRRSLAPGLSGGSGTFNALFVPARR